MPKFEIGNKARKKGYKWTVKHKNNISAAKSGKGYKPSLRIDYRKQEEIAGRPRPKYCEVCWREDKKICFDHNHKTGKFRGWLCHKCNVVLGMVEDNPEILINLVKYLNSKM